ncbi:MAG TPA: BrnT family toxin [Acidobacteriaceae bacterium]
MFDWDEANIAHIAEHDVLPKEAEEVVLNNPLDLEEQDRNGESRLMQLGETANKRLLVVVTTPRGSKIRVVTAFAANRAYREFYAAHKTREDHGEKNSS